MSIVIRDNPAIKWGDNFENTLVFPYPIERAVARRPLRKGFQTVQGLDGAEDAWIVGRDFELSGDLRWLDLGDWTGPLGVQAFLDWARDKRKFRFCPQASNLDFWVDECYLVEPWDDEPHLEQDNTRRLSIKMRSRHMDFGVALRGLGLDVSPGLNWTKPLRGRFSRVGSARYHTSRGTVGTASGDVIRDRHFEGAVRTIFAESIVTNHCLRSEEIDNGTWTKTNLTISSNAAVAPDEATTADRLVETVTASSHHITQAITIVADEWLAASIYVKAQQRFRGRFLVRNSAVNNEITMTVRLDTGVIVSSGFAGSATLLRAAIIPLANGWYRLELEGKVGGGFTAMNYIWAVHDDADAESYTGDTSKGMLVWGTQMERSTTAIKIASGAYIPTTSGTGTKNLDAQLWTSMNWPWSIQRVWFYLKFIDKGMALRGDFSNWLWWGEATGATPQIRMLCGQSTAGSTPFYRMNWSHDGGSTQSGAIANVTPAIGDTVELFGVVLANGNVELHQSINGGTTATFTGSGGQSLAGKLILPRLVLFNSGTGALIKCKVGFASWITTLAQARGA